MLDTEATVKLPTWVSGKMLEDKLISVNSGRVDCWIIVGNTGRDDSTVSK